MYRKFRKLIDTHGFARRRLSRSDRAASVTRCAQEPLVDLIIGFLIFALAFVISFQSWNAIRISIANSEDAHYFEASVYQSAESLIKNQGEPRNWESTNASITFIGLADDENLLNSEKLSALNRTDYDSLRDYVLSTGDYQITVSNTSGIIYQTGRPPAGEVTVVRVDRLIMINNSYYTFTFKGWRA